MINQTEIIQEQQHKEINKLIEICHANLKNSSECLNYLTKTRKLSQEIISKYKLGYFPQNINRLTQAVSEAILQKLTIIDYSGNSPFSEFFYLIFPIFSEQQEATAIGGRTLLDEYQRSIYNLPKYKNSSYKKNQVLYGLNHSKLAILKEKNVYIVEGFFDQIALDSNGIKNSVAICGTAFSRNHFYSLSKYTDRFTFILDQDDGGRKAMEKICKVFDSKGAKLNFLLLPPGCKDIDQYFLSNKSKEDFVRDLKLFTPDIIRW